MYIGNTGTTKVVGHDDPEFKLVDSSIDPQAGTWERIGRYGESQIQLIGGGNRTDRFRNGVIGVYDCTQPSHVKLLVKEALQAGARKR